MLFITLVCVRPTKTRGAFRLQAIKITSVRCEHRGYGISNSALPICTTGDSPHWKRLSNFIIGAEILTRRIKIVTSDRSTFRHSKKPTLWHSSSDHSQTPELEIKSHRL